MARRGLGIALGQRRLAQPWIDSGALVALSAATLPLGHPYCAIHPHAKARKPALKRLLALLVQPR